MANRKNHKKFTGFRFSIRGLFLAIVFVSILTAWWHHSINRPRIAIAYLATHANLVAAELQTVQSSNRPTIYKWVAWISGLEYDPASVTTIRNGMLTSLVLLPCFSNLEVLQNYAFVDRSELPSLLSLTKLRLLVLDTNAKDLQFLANLSNLETLSIKSHELKDTTALMGCRRLESVHFNGCPIEDLSASSHLQSMKTLSLAQTRISEICWLSGLTQLEVLSLTKTPLRSLEGIENCLKLKHVDLSESPIEDITPLKRLNQISFLNLANTAVFDSGPIRGLTELTDLDLSNTNVANLESLAKLTKLQRLALSGTPITSEQLRNVPVLIDLKTREENEKTRVENEKRASEHAERLEAERAKVQEQSTLPDLSLVFGPGTSISEMTHLDLSKTEIETIDALSKQNNLTNLNLADTQVTDISPLDALPFSELDLSNTKVSDLSRLMLRGIDTLNLRNTHVTRLPSVNIDGEPEFALNSFELLDLRGAPFRDFGQLEHLDAYHLAISLDEASEAQIDHLVTIETLTLYGPVYSSIEQLKPLKNLKNLEVHDQIAFEITDALMELNLESLVFVRSKVNTNRLSTKHLPHRVEYRDCQIDDLNWLTNSNLESLTLENCTFSQSFEMPLLPQLINLTITNSGTIRWQGISALQNLEVIRLADNDIGNLSFLGRLRKLNVLDLEHSQISDLLELGHLKYLRHLNLPRQNLSDDELSALRRLIPRCRVYYDDKEFVYSAFGGIF